MKRPVTGTVAALILATAVGPLSPAAAEGPFTEIPITEAPPRSRVAAYLTAATGAGMIAGSFVLANRANHAYRDYLVESEPNEIQRLWDRTVLNDRLASAALLGGEAMIAAAIYLAFLRGPADREGRAALDAPRPTRSLTLRFAPSRCALAWRF